MQANEYGPVDDAPITLRRVARVPYSFAAWMQRNCKTRDEMREALERNGYVKPVTCHV